MSNTSEKKLMKGKSNTPSKSRRAAKRSSLRAGAGGMGNRREGDIDLLGMSGTRVSGGFTSVFSSARAQPDVMIVKMRYETTSAFTSTSGAASYVQIKGNSIYRPYVGNTDSCGGYARMYADYELGTVIDSKVTVRLWGGVSGQDEPFRVVAIPCSPTQYTTYSGFSNVCQLWDVPHCVQGTFSPGGALPVIRAQGTNASVMLGQSRETGIEGGAGGTVSNYGAVTGADPSALWYFLIGYQNFAGTTTTNQQAQVSIEYTVKFFRPIATPVQVTVNKYGMEEIPPAKGQGSSETKTEAKAERKEPQGLIRTGPTTFSLQSPTIVEESDDALMQRLLAESRARRQASSSAAGLASDASKSAGAGCRVV